MQAVFGMFDINDMVQVVIDGYTSSCLPIDKLVPRADDNFAHIEKLINDSMLGGISADANPLRWT